MNTEQLNQEMSQLHQSISLKNVRLDEACTKEEDLLRQLTHQLGAVHRRDQQIDDQFSQIDVLNKEIEDQIVTQKRVEASNNKLDEYLKETNAELTSVQEKLKFEVQHANNLDGQLQ